MSLYKMNISDKTTNAMQNSDSEVQQMLENAQQNNQTQPPASNGIMDIIKELFGFGDAQSSDLGEIANLRSISDPKTPKLALEPLYPNFGAPMPMETNNPYNYAPELDVNLDPEVNMGATGTVPTLKQGIMSQVDSGFPLYDDFTVAEGGDDLEDNAVTVDELGNLKQPSGIAKLLDYVPFVGEKSLGRAIIDMLPKMSPEAKNMRNFYGSRYGLTDTGQVASGIMKGYNPVYGGFLNTITGGRFGTPTQYGLAPAIRRRIDRIANRKIAQTDTSRARIKELQDLARADTISRARQANPGVYASADKQGFTDSSGGFKSAGTNENFSNKTGRGRTGY